MAEVTTIEARLRDRAGKGAARATRRAGLVPGVIYGAKQEPTLIAIDPRVLSRELHQPGFSTRLFDVRIDGSSQRALARDVQFHPVTDVPIHIDFLRVSAGATIHVEVPVVFENESRSPGLRRGGVLNIVRHAIEVVCAVDAIPTAITVNLEGREIGDSVHISHVTLPEGVTPTITDRDFTIATIAAPTVKGDEEAGEAEAEEE